MTIRRLHKTHEEKIAEKITDLLSDIRLDLDQIGIYLARNSKVGYNRLMLITEAAEFERELEDGRQHYTLF